MWLVVPDKGIGCWRDRFFDAEEACRHADQKYGKGSWCLRRII